MIAFKNVTKLYSDESVVLDNVSFEIKEGEFVSIVGKSGAGKTTLLHLILGLDQPTSGDVYFNDINVNAATHDQIQEIRRRVGVVYQDYRLLLNKTVYENVAYILEVEGKENSYIEAEVPKVLDIIGLKDKVDNYPEQLSGGEQQRLAIARALVSKPDYIIADEPTGNLDPYNTYEIISLLEKINKTGKTVILATHDMEVINRLGRRVVTLESGKILRDEPQGRFII